MFLCFFGPFFLVVACFLLGLSTFDFCRFSLKVGTVYPFFSQLTQDSTLVSGIWGDMDLW